MNFKLEVFLIGLIALLESTFAAPTESTLTVEEAQKNLDNVVRIETEKFLNGLFSAQIGFFERVKEKLSPDVQRVKDIDSYIQRLKQAIDEKVLTDKDKMWLETFKEFNRSPLLLNIEDETGLETPDYERILVECGLQEVVKNCMADLAAYFWKMAKASGKVMEVKIDDYVDGLKHDNRNKLF